MSYFSQYLQEWYCLQKTLAEESSMEIRKVAWYQLSSDEYWISYPSLAATISHGSSKDFVELIRQVDGKIALSFIPYSNLKTFQKINY